MIGSVFAAISNHGLSRARVLNNGLDHININSLLKIPICGLILPLVLIIDVYVQKLRESRG